MLNKHFVIALLMAPVVVLSGCGSSKEKAAASESANAGAAVVTFGGKPVITVESLEADFNTLLDENPQLRQVLALMPDAKMNFLRGMTSQAVVDHYVDAKGYSDTQEYKDKLNEKMRNVKRMLNIEYFGQDFPAVVSEADMKKVYEENKDKLVISHGGVKAVGVSFTSEAKAKDFLKKVEPKSADLMKLAQAEGAEARDFKIVNAQSVGINPAVRDAIVAIKNVPSAIMVKAGNDFWVVKATAKEAAQYHPYEQVKGEIEQKLKNEAQMKRFEEEIERLKKDYDVVIHEELVQSANPAEGMNISAEQLMQMAQEEEPVAAAPAAEKATQAA